VEFKLGGKTQQVTVDDFNKARDAVKAAHPTPRSRRRFWQHFLVSDVPELLAALRQAVWPEQDLAGRTVLVTAGPTREALDPVRFLSNPSTGRQGYAIAEAAACRRRILLRCFGDDLEQDCGRCDVCANPPKLWDGTVAAQKLLSAVLRTGQRFGVGHVIDVLRGRLTDKVAQHGHDQLPTFGVGKDVSDVTWRGVARQLVAQGALDVAVENHGELLPTEAARPILKGQAAVMMRADMIETGSPAARDRERASPVTSDNPAFDALREWRKSEAKAQGVPAYVIFHDRTLAEIADRMPTSLDQLAEVPGVGATKLERYGDAVLEVMRGV
jgi:ATP-dependent DNA helicase RecQ